MPSTLVGDVAYVVRIETLRATPLVIDRSTKAISALDRAFGLWPRLVNASPAKLLPETANLCCLSSNAIYLLAYRVANQKAARIQFAVWKASIVATPKNSRNIVKFVPNLIFLISTSISDSVVNAG